MAREGLNVEAAILKTDWRAIHVRRSPGVRAIVNRGIRIHVRNSHRLAVGVVSGSWAEYRRRRSDLGPHKPHFLEPRQGTAIVPRAIGSRDGIPENGAVPVRKN